MPDSALAGNWRFHSNAGGGKSSAKLFSSGRFWSVLPLVGGLSVYCVTRTNVGAFHVHVYVKAGKRVVNNLALLLTSPASALACFWFNKSVDCSCQSGSLVVISARDSLLAPVSRGVS